jgi:NitT/TauT family transport system substrate-binding protein
MRTRLHHLGRALIGFAVGATLLAGCSGSSAGSPSAPARSQAPAASAPTSGTTGAASAPALVPAKVAFTTIAAAQAPFWVAFEAGYFQAQGLNVPDMNRIEPGATLLAALHNGEIDLAAAGGPSLILGTLQGLDVVVVGSNLDVIEDAVVARPEIRTVADLRGKTIGVSRLKAISDVAARLGLQRVGLTPDVDVFLRGTGGIAESMAAMEQGTVAAASVSEPAIYAAEKRGYSVLIDVTGMRIPFTAGGMGTTRSILNSRGDVVERILRALAQGTHRFKTEPAYAMEVTRQYTGIEDPEVLQRTINVYTPLFSVDPYPDLAAVQAVLDAEDAPEARTAKPQDVVDLRPAERLRQSGLLDQFSR